MRRLLLEDARDPDWSPDGRTLAVVRHDGGTPSIWVVRADRTGARQVVPDAFSPVWSPDCRSVAFSTPRRRERVGVATRDAKDRRFIMKRTRMVELAWQPRS